MIAILPILPALWGLMWLLGLLLAPGLWWLFRQSHWRLALAFVKSQWRGFAVLTALAIAVPSTYSAALSAFNRSDDLPPKTNLSFHSWPTARGSLLRTGSDDCRGPRELAVLWAARTDYVFLSSPAICGKYVVAVGSKGDTARCFCWNLITGEELWSGGPTDYRMTLSSPVLHDGLIFCGEGVHHTPNSRLLCLDPRLVDRHSVAWFWQTASHVECTPACDEKTVYVAAGDDGVYAFRTDPTLTAQERLLWHTTGDRLPDAETALAVHNGRVYVGLGHGGTALVALDANTGAELHRATFSMPVFAPPAILGDTLIIGLGPGNLVDAATAGPGELRCLDLEALQTRGRLETSASVLSAPAIHAHNAVCVVADGQVLTIDRKANLLRQWRSPTPILSSAAVSHDLVYCVDADGLLTALDADQMAPVRRLRLGPSGLFVSSPVVARGRVIVGTPAGLMCVGETP